MINERTPQRNISKSMLFKVRNKTKNKSKISKTMFVQDFTYLRVKILASGCDFCHFTFQVLRVQRLNFNEGRQGSCKKRTAKIQNFLGFDQLRVTNN